MTEQVPKKKAKARQTRKKTPIPQHDLFTTLCKTDLGAECVKEHRFHPKRQWRFDYALPAHKIALEVEGGVWTGGRHTSPKGFLGDVEKYNTATLMGWRVFRCTPDTLYKADTLKLLKIAISGDFCPEND